MISGALQMAGSDVMTIRQITGPTYDTSAESGGYYYFGSGTHNAATLSDFGVYGLKTTITPKSSDSWIVVVYKTQVRWYDNAHNSGGEMYLTVGNTKAQGQDHDGTHIPKSKVWQHISQSGSGTSQAYLYQAESHVVFIPPSDHTTDEMVFDVIIACYNSDACYVYNGPDKTDIHAIEIG